MRDEGGMFDRIRARGQEFITQVSNELMMNPNFIKAMQTALKGKEKLDQAVAQTLKSMNLPSRSEFNRALSRIEVLEAELAAQRRRAAAHASSGDAAPARRATAKATASRTKTAKGATRGGAKKAARRTKKTAVAVTTEARPADSTGE